MLICENTDTGERIVASKEQKIELTRLSKTGLLRCPIPICHNSAIFKTECIYTDHEPESEEHLTGKNLIWELLSRLYPDSKVELESWITETCQEADVLVTHPDGSRWAFEFQWSKISADKWKERHSLYQKAKIKDSWIFNIDLYTPDMDKLMTPYVKIPGMLSEAIKNDYNLLTFFSPQEKCFRLIFANYTWNGYVNRFYNATEEDFRVEDVVFVNGNFSSPKFDEFRKKKDLEIEETKIMME